MAGRRESHVRHPVPARAQQLGEGRYDEAERRVQQLLREAGRPDVPDGLVSPQGQGTQAAPGATAPHASETYLGAARAEGFVGADGARAVATDRTAFAPAPRLSPGEWTLAGAWQVTDDRLEAAQAGARLVYRFRARDVNLVMGPATGGRPLHVLVRVDGHAPGSDAGSDVDADGRGVVDARRLYQLVRQQGDASRPRTVEIQFLDAGARAYSFTFG